MVDNIIKSVAEKLSSLSYIEAVSYTHLFQQGFCLRSGEPGGRSL